MLTVGSLFSGYGGLDLAVELALGPTSTRWVSDVEPGPNAILAQRFPGVPNLGDITAIDWTAVEPVDIVCGGSPCQDLSSAGQRAGMRPGTRSGLWESMTHAINHLHPRLVVWENVLGALSASAYSRSDVEPGTGPMGNRPDGPVLRALGRVLGDLTNLGYDAEWATVRAADVGAPHGRRRVFVIAYPRGERPQGRFKSGVVGAEHSEPGSNGLLLPTPLTEDTKLLSTPQARDGKGTPGDGYNLASLPRDVALLPTPSATQGAALRESPGEFQDLGRTVHSLLPTPTSTVRDRTPSQVSTRFGIISDRTDRGPNLDDVIHLPQEWGDYASAIHHWEQVLGRPAPEPTKLSETGKPQLSPAFVEWMMGLPQGWVTDVEISRAQQLRALGNGVVPQQGAAAITQLIGRG